MIRHLVLLRFKADVDESTKTTLMERLAGLRQHLRGVVDFQHCHNISIETPLVRGFTRVFWFDFVDKQARDAYVQDAEHQKVGALLVQHLQGGLDGIYVCDLEL